MEIDHQSPSYYSILGVSTDSSVEEVKRAYRKLAMQWHPDRWTRTPSLLGEAKRKFQQIQEAYSVLSDEGKRTMYDAGLYDPNDEEEEGFSDFMQEMLSLMAQTRREGKNYSLEELQTMLMEMAQGFESTLSTPWFCGPSIFENSGQLKRTRWDSYPVADGCSHLHVSGFQMYGTGSYCD